MMRCTDCPVRLNVPCKGETFPGLCLLKNRTDYRDLIIGMSREPSLPPLASQLRSALVATGRIAAAAVTDQPVLASQEVQERRLAVCRQGRGLPLDQVEGGQCDQYRSSDSRCAACGCVLPGAKAALLTEDCPLGRWARD